MTDRVRLLPLMPPRLLSRELAAEYCGVSVGAFDEHIAKAVPPVEIGRRNVWDIRALDRYLDELSGLAPPPLRPIEEGIAQLGKKSTRR